MAEIKDIISPSNPRENFNFKSFLEFYQLTQPTGAPQRGLTDNLYGINHQNVKNFLPESRDSVGLTFFTRPQLNMGDINLRNERMLYNLLTTESKSVYRYVRMMLDPRLGTGNNKLSCPLIDNQLAFIPVLTNNLISVSGWPDITLDVHNSKSGVRREVHSMVDSPIDIYYDFDINCTFKNVKEDPLFALFITWGIYMSRVFDGAMSPYLDFITENELDYNTRIYRLILDESRTYVKKIAATGASFPVNVPVGKFFDYNDSTPYSEQNKTIDITFKCNGANYMDPVLIYEFNKTVGIFNPDMREENRSTREIINRILDRAPFGMSGSDVRNFNSYGSTPSSNMVKIPISLIDKFNFRGYPRINPDTSELEWWVNKNSAYYTKVMRTLINDDFKQALQGNQ